MDREWNDSQPIYRQLRDRRGHDPDGVLNEGDPLPSVRNVAAEFRVNPITVLKGYQELVDEQLVETRRGRGMFINAGARELLMRGERQKFLAEQWPRIAATIQRLGLTPKELLDASGPMGRRQIRQASKPHVGRSAEWPHEARGSADLAPPWPWTCRARVEDDGSSPCPVPQRGGNSTASRHARPTPYQGELTVLGRDPGRRDQLLRRFGHRRWRCCRLDPGPQSSTLAGVHPRFDRAKAEGFLARTNIRRTSKVRELSKGMVTQLHLAVVMAIDAKLLVLDEPTLGLDILVRKQFYDSLLNDYFDRSRTIVVTTHQIDGSRKCSPTSVQRPRRIFSAAAWSLQSRYPR